MSVLRYGSGLPTAHFEWLPGAGRHSGSAPGLLAGAPSTQTDSRHSPRRRHTFYSDSLLEFRHEDGNPGVMIVTTSTNFLAATLPAFGEGI